MKVITNFDFYNAVKDVNESLLPVKVIRNNQKTYIQLFPVYLSATLIIKQFTDMDAKAIIPTIIKPTINMIKHIKSNLSFFITTPIYFFHVPNTILQSNYISHLSL